MKAVLKPCKYGHFSERTKAHVCKECQRIRVRRPDVKKKMRAANKRRYLEVRSTVLDQQKSYRTTPRGRALQMKQGIAARSRKKQCESTITIDWLERRLTAGVCEITGLRFDLSKLGMKGPYAPSIDRIDSSLGYTADNCRMILWAMNTAFSWWGEATFATIAKAWMSAPRSINAAKNIAMLGSRQPTSVCGNDSKEMSAGRKRGVIEYKKGRWAAVEKV